MRPFCLSVALRFVRVSPIPPRLTALRCLSSGRPLLSAAAVDPELTLPEPLSLQPLLRHDDVDRQSQPLVSHAPRKHHDPRSKNLPVSCPGCGALTQDVDADSAGYFTLPRRAVKAYLRSFGRIAQWEVRKETELEREDECDEPKDTSQMKENEDQEHEEPNAGVELPPSPPICDRCHYLTYESRGTPIAHPTIEAIADSIAESPFTRNHIYHVADAADFPMSLIPSIHRDLSLAKPRTQNRRSQHTFSNRPSMSFIITRSDLLAPTKELVDSLMPKFSSVLRTALGRSGEKLRLGNVHLVSSKRGWWTRDIKDTIRSRGGGNWMVGKFNVGKSNLFEVLFPKRSPEDAAAFAELRRQEEIDVAPGVLSTPSLSETALLPPPQPEMLYPVLPLVSKLPGTTASPIRIPFGNGKGELIDMPGLARGGLDQFVKSGDKSTLVMEHRPTVTQYVVKPGQSLLLGGGLVRITPFLDPDDPSTTLLVYPFVPLEAHVTATDKAEGTQTQQRQSGVESILEAGAGASMSTAGRFKLQTDVTKSRAGSMLRAGVNPDKLAFRVYATDILIEGVGWVELVCQVRKYRRPFQAGTPPVDSTQPQTEEVEVKAPSADDISFGTNTFTPFGGDRKISDTGTTDSLDSFPEVEIFSPNGKHIGQRTCMDLWQLWHQGRLTKMKSHKRPKKSMKGAKKRGRVARREALKAAT